MEELEKGQHHQLPSAPCSRYLEVVRCVAVGVLWHVQEDEQVLPEVVSHGSKPGEAVGRKAEGHHLRGGRPRGLDELRKGGRFWSTLLAYATQVASHTSSYSQPTSTSAGVSLQFLTSITVMMSSVVSSRRFRSTFTSSSVISGPREKMKVQVHRLTATPPEVDHLWSTRPSRGLLPALPTPWTRSKMCLSTCPTGREFSIEHLEPWEQPITPFSTGHMTSRRRNEKVTDREVV